MDKLNISDIDDMTSYANAESNISQKDKVIIDSFKSSIKVENKTQTIINLRRIREIASLNQANLEQMFDNVNVVKNVLRKEIEDLQSETTLKELFGSDIDKNILSICSAQFNQYYARIQELEYRLNICSYRDTFIKEAKQSIADDINLLNKYLIALQEI